MSEFVSGNNDAEVLQAVRKEVAFADKTFFAIEATFENGRGVSIVRHVGSSGGKRGFFEIALLDSQGGIDSSVAPEGWLDHVEVIGKARSIAAMPTKVSA